LKTNRRKRGLERCRRVRSKKSSKVKKKKRKHLWRIAR